MRLTNDNHSYCNQRNSQSSDCRRRFNSLSITVFN